MKYFTLLVALFAACSLYAGEGLPKSDSLSPNPNIVSIFKLERPNIAPIGDSSIWGTPQYYLWRKADIEHRMTAANFRKVKAPSYYEGFGFKYATAFWNKRLEDTVFTLAGNQFIERVIIELQLELEWVLYEKPLAELSSLYFKSLAYGSHPKAYITSGFLELPILDKLEVAITVEPSDLLGPLGLKQLSSVGVAYLKYMSRNTEFRISQIEELRNNKVLIIEKIQRWLKCSDEEARSKFQEIEAFLLS